MTISDLHVGAKLLIKCRSDWRCAAISRRLDSGVVLVINSPKGRTYRRGVAPETKVGIEGGIYLVGEDDWRSGLVRYDVRW